MKQINSKCPHCGKVTILEMTDEQYHKYTHNESYIEDIFPDWSPAKREMLITGICPDCWNKIFNYDE